MCAQNLTCPLGVDNILGCTWYWLLWLPIEKWAKTFEYDTNVLLNYQKIWLDEEKFNFNKEVIGE